MPERTPSDANLMEFLSDRARSASDGRLALDVGLGCIVAVAALVWRPGGWHVIGCAGVCFAAFGAWGITDRELRERSGAPMNNGRLRTLRLGRAAAAAIGTVAAALLLVSLLGIALGTWIS